MSILAWIVVGLIAGFIASRIMGSGGGLVFDLVLGIVGAVVGGWLFSYFGGPAPSGINIVSILVAIVGACVVLFVYRLLTRRRV